MKTTFKKLLLTLSAVMLFAVVLCFNANALEATGSCGENTAYKFNSETGELVISGQGEIETWSFQHCAEIKSVIIEKGITKLGYGCFEYCKNLTDVSIPESVIFIDDGVFNNCEKLKKATIPESVVILGEAVFNSCSELTEVNIKCNITSLEDDLFYNCTKLEKVILPDTVTEIGARAFWYCTNLKDIKIPKSVKNIRHQAFIGCESLTSIIIPEGTLELGYGVFNNCTNLKYITVPGSVIKIGSSFINTQWYKDQPDGLIYLGKVAIAYKGDMPENTKITIEEGTVSIASSAFWKCRNLVDITIPDSVVNIGTGAFEGTDWYNKQPDGMVYAGKVFYEYKGEMPKNTTLVLENGTKGISEYAFHKNENLTGIVIPNSVKNIGSNAFAGCKNLKKVTLLPGITKIRENTFSECENLEEITIPHGVTEIEDCAFSNCKKLKNVVLPESLQIIGEGAFEYCERFTRITIPQGVEVLDYNLFDFCSNITDVTIPVSVKWVRGRTFSGNEKLQNVFYTGTEEEWSKLFVTKICSGYFTNAHVYYNSTLCNHINVTYHEEKELISCAEPGYAAGERCEDCNVWLTGHEIFEKLHNYEYIYEVPPTCTENGLTAGNKCSECGIILDPQDVVPATGHKIKILKAKSATCTEEGLTEGKKCITCGKMLKKQTVIPATGHKLEEILVKPTCTKGGYQKYVCACGYYKEYGFVALGHNEATLKAVKPTYTKTGLTEGKKCKTCGKVTVKQKKVAKKKLKKVTISSVKSTKKATALVIWEKVTDASGYIVEYSTSKKFTKKTTKTVKIKKGKTVKTTLKKLKSGKKYYVRIRAYKTVSKKTVYGSYSSVKTVKIK